MEEDQESKAVVETPSDGPQNEEKTYVAEPKEEEPSQIKEEATTTQNNVTKSNTDETRVDSWNNEADTDEHLDDETSKAEATLSQSMSNEFTYTTFGKPLDSDEPQNDDTSLASPSAVNFDKLIVSDNNVDDESTTKPKYDTLDLHSVDIETKADRANATEIKRANSQSESEDSIRKMPFDSIIENVKLNKIANKEVCDYILNLLVNGEFDLEKKFIIQNMKSIMHMIQVIKCARPSLKVIDF